MDEHSLNAHIGYLEGEAKKIDDRVNKLEAMIRGSESEEKKHALQELTNRLRDEASEHRKYVALVRGK